MLQSELMVSAQVKAEGDPLKSHREKLDSLTKERETFVEAISTIDDELSELRLYIRREEKRLKLYKGVKEQVFEFVKNNEGIFLHFDIRNIFLNKGFGRIETVLDEMIKTGYLILNEKGRLHSGVRPKRKEHGSVKEAIFKLLNDGDWYSSKELGLKIDIPRNSLISSVKMYVNRGYIEVDDTKRYKLYRLKKEHRRS